MNIDALITNLKQNNMDGYYIESKEELIPLLETLIQEGEVVGCGDSVTLEQLHVYDFLRSGAYEFLDKYDANLTKKAKKQLYRDNFFADTFLTGTNAITLDGKLFNIDGNGSRVAPMIYGPDQVIVVVGVNKIVKSIDEAIQRTRQIAAPLDAKRLGKDTPCVSLQRCIDCKHPMRICNDFVLIARQFQKNRIKVIVVNDVLGY